MRQLVAGSRGSDLARWQTNFVIQALTRRQPDLRIEMRILQPSGDRDPQRPLDAFAVRGVFTDAVEQALLNGEIDLAVHSLKDLPTRENKSLVLAAIPVRADARDVIVSRHGLGLMALPPRARVGTGSTRRAAQVLAVRPDVQVIPLRGNVDTRLRRAAGMEYDAIVLAAAGIQRLGRSAEITEYLPLETFLPAPGQGALAVQIRTADPVLLELVRRIDEPILRAATAAERAFSNAWGSGCALPVGAYAAPAKDGLLLRGFIGTRDGKRMLRGARVGTMQEAEGIGERLAVELQARGGKTLLEEES